METGFLSCNFVVDAVVARIHSGDFPDDASAKSMDRMPIVDLLRRRLGSDPQYIAPLVARVNSGDGVAAGLACSLLRHHAHRPEVAAALQARWQSASDVLRHRLLWRILDVPELSHDWHERLSEFTFDQWEGFASFNRTYYGSNPVGLILSRLIDPSFPNAKKWAYLCSAASCIDDTTTATAVLNVGRSLADQFGKTVADRLLAQRASNANRLA